MPPLSPTGASLLAAEIRCHWEGRQVRLAEALGVSEAAVSRWISGQCRPDGDQRLALERITARRLPVESWSRPVAAGGPLDADPAEGAAPAENVKPGATEAA